MKECLIVIDFQNDFVDGTLGFDSAKNIEDKVLTKLENAKKNNTDIIFTLDTHYDNYLETHEGKNLPIKHCLKGSVGHNVYGEAKNYLENAKVFEKNSFGSLELGNYLKEKRYKKVELVGLVTNMCIISTAVITQAALPEAIITVDRLAVDSFNKDLHEKTFEILEAMYFNII